LKQSVFMGQAGVLGVGVGVVDPPQFSIEIRCAGKAWAMLVALGNVN